MSAVMETLLNEPAESVERSDEVPSKTPEAKRRIEVGADPKPAAHKSPLRPVLLAVLPPVLGLAFLVLVWQIVSYKTGNFPSPAVKCYV